MDGKCERNKKLDIGLILNYLELDAYIDAIHVLYHVQTIKTENYLKQETNTFESDRKRKSYVNTD